MTTHSVHHAAYYDDEHFNYPRIRTGRNYEHAAEVMAVRKLLHGLTFEHAIDVGGGYGRLCLVISEFAERVSLADSSRQQQFEDGSADLVTMIGVLHHLPDPTPELRELHRILRPSGLALIEVRKLDGIPFVNHHPVLLIGQLRAIGLRLERVLSASNTRHWALIKSVPKPALLAAERALQVRLAPMYFGPSIYMLLRKPSGAASADEGSASEYSADLRAGLPVA